MNMSMTIASPIAASLDRNSRERTKPAAQRPSRYIFGVPGVNQTGLDAHIVKARLDGELTDNLDWSTTVLYGDYDKFYTNVFANGAATGPTGTVALSRYIDPTKRQNFIAQTNLVWEVNLGPVGNKILMGLEYGDQNSSNQRRNGTLSNSSLNLANIVYPTVTFGALARGPHDCNDDPPACLPSRASMRSCSSRPATGWNSRSTSRTCSTSSISPTRITTTSRPARRSMHASRRG